jgi:hypothetical protein
MRRRHYTWVFVVAARLVIDLSPVGAATLTPDDPVATIQALQASEEGRGIIMLVPGAPGCPGCLGRGQPPITSPLLPPPTSPPPKSLPYTPPPPEDPPDDGEDEGGGELPEKGPGEPFWLWPSTSGPWPI